MSNCIKNGCFLKHKTALQFLDKISGKAEWNTARCIPQNIKRL